MRQQSSRGLSDWRCERRSLRLGGNTNHTPQTSLRFARQDIELANVAIESKGIAVLLGTRSRMASESGIRLAKRPKDTHGGVRVVGLQLLTDRLERVASGLANKRKHACITSRPCLPPMHCGKSLLYQAREARTGKE